MTHTPKDTGREIMHQWGKKCLAPILKDTDHIFDCDAGTVAIIRAILEERKAERERCAVIADTYKDKYPLRRVQSLNIATAIRKQGDEA